MQTIDSDNEETWPETLVTGLKRLAGELHAFHIERRRIESAAQDHVMLRVNPPRNPHQLAWDEALELANTAIAGSCLLGFHATRLTPNEQQDIARSGLKLLSGALFEARLFALQAEGFVTAAQSASLRTRHQVLDNNRSGKTWFCFNRSLLREEWGISRFFRSWGGEALYNSHEDDSDTGPILRTIGTPCIVIAAAPLETIETFMSVGKRLVNVWASRRGIPIADKPEFEGYSRCDTSADKVLRIVNLGDTEFPELTQHDQWNDPISDVPMNEAQDAKDAET